MDMASKLFTFTFTFTPRLTVGTTRLYACVWMHVTFMHTHSRKAPATNRPALPRGATQKSQIEQHVKAVSLVEFSSDCVSVEAAMACLVLFLVDPSCRRPGPSPLLA